jgi:glutathione S-transferase
MKLYYFEGAGRAEAIRLLLNYVGAKYEDVRFTKEDWPKNKDRFELKQVPVLEDNGRQYCQSYAIMEYLGAKYDLIPKGYGELYKCLFIMNTAEDLFIKAYVAVSPTSPLDAAGKEAALKKLFEGEGPLLLKAIEKKLKENCTQDFMVGSKYTIADFFLLGFYASILNVPDWNKAFAERIKTKYPLLQAYADKRMVDFNSYYKKCKTKLHYFDMPGRGEMIRVMLKHMKMPFEDVRIKFDEWPKLKSSGKYELQQLPIVECEPCGVNMCQADAIMHKMGARYGYLPMKCPEKLYKVVWFCNTLKDIMDNCGRIAFSPLPEEKKKTMRADFFAKTLPIFLEAMQNRLKSNKCQHVLVGKSYTIADFYFVGVWRGFVLSPMFPEFKDIVAKFPVLLEYFAKQDKML